MKNLFSTTAKKMMAGITVLFVIAGFSSCKKNDTPADLPANHQSFTEVSLVSSDASITATRTDAHLLNGWGISFNPAGTIWISSSSDHTSAVYNSTGAQVLAPVTIPSHAGLTGGTPTGQVFNSSLGFKLPNGNPAKFIFVGTDGVISGWNTGTAAVTLVDRNNTSVYTGVAIANVATDTLLFAADFNSGKIDAFDKNFVLQPAAFADPNLPAGYSPFNIQNIGGQLYVTYAQLDPNSPNVKRGAGLGIVNVFSAGGVLVKRLVTGGLLNAPWGITMAPDGWLNGTTGTILIGNLGDGHINAYNTSGSSLGTLQNNGTAITIDGLWGLSFAPTTATTINPNWLFFTAGPVGETKGLFGYVSN